MVNRVQHGNADLNIVTPTIVNQRSEREFAIAGEIRANTINIVMFNRFNDCARISAAASCCFCVRALRAVTAPLSDYFSCYRQLILHYLGDCGTVLFTTLRQNDGNVLAKRLKDVSRGAACS